MLKAYGFLMVAVQFYGCGAVFYPAGYHECPKGQISVSSSQKHIAVATMKIIGIIRRKSTERSAMHPCVNLVA